VLRLLRSRCDAGAAGVLVTHEARHAAWADRVVFLRDGVVVDQTGPVATPESLLDDDGLGSR
jgi:putative ABC transport system ATP-binding protein